ncbi:MAG: class I SAM-dependent methyltransferase [Candidatus Marinimicrobia bacterium]|nr:class I SAM-dependent methyltransferase [Candidatus Neomarinimicrobiota bacterium]
MEYKRVPPYTHSSGIYDHLMADVDYEGWCDYIADLAESFGFGTASVYDLSCGTGTFLNLFPAAKKYGIDLSEPMIRVAKALHPGIRFSTGNMLRPPLKNVDLYVNIHDALNYISSFDAVRDHIRYMAKHLKPGQTYVFDFAMRGVINEYFTDTSYEDTSPAGISFKRQNTFDEKKNIAVTDLYIYYPDGRAFHEQHHQYIFDYREIVKLSVEFPSRSFIFLEEFTFDEAHEASNRMLVVMQ